MQDWRLLHTAAAAGDWNMAVDAALMEWAARERRCALRFYTWAQPTLSLGYFQPHDARADHAASRDLPVVRRASGGGAIVHDRELTYSLVAPSDHAVAIDARRLYELVHGGLIGMLLAQGIGAVRCERGSPATAREPFLCFQRRAEGDVLVEGTKIAGSAQRRRRGAILQHGSVLLAASPAAPELPGLAELGPRAIEAAELAHRWGAWLADKLAIRWSRDELSPSEVERAGELVDEVYGDPEWTLRR